MKYGGAAASEYEGPRPRQRVHVFDADYLLDCVMRLVEIVRRYEFVIEHLLSDEAAVRPFALGGDEFLASYLRRVEDDIVRRALAQTGGRRVEAMKLARTSYRRQFERHGDSFPPGVP